MLERLAKSLDDIANRITNGSLHALERSFVAIALFIVRVKSYFARLFSSIGLLCRALVKLSIFFIPSVVFWLLAYIFGSLLLFALGLILAVAVILAGRYYRP